MDDSIFFEVITKLGFHASECRALVLRSSLYVHGGALKLREFFNEQPLPPQSRHVERTYCAESGKIA